MSANFTMLVKIKLFLLRCHKSQCLSGDGNVSIYPYSLAKSACNFYNATSIIKKKTTGQKTFVYEPNFNLPVEQKDDSQLITGICLQFDKVYYNFCLKTLAPSASHFSYKFFQSRKVLILQWLRVGPSIFRIYSFFLVCTNYKLKKIRQT